MIFNKVELGKVCEILDSKRKPITKRDRISGEFPYYGATGIVDYVGEYIFDEKLVLIGEDGAKWESGDKTAFIAEGKYWVNNHAHVIKPLRNLILDEWIVYYFLYKDLREFVTGLTVPKLNQSQLKNIPIPLPSITTQQKIVKKLDAIFAEIDKAVVATESNIKNAQALFQSYLTEVFENGNSDWIELNLKEVTSKIGSGATPKGGSESYKETGISLIRSMNVYDNGFLYNNLAFIDERQAKELNNVAIEKDDVLINITGASVARCCIVPEEVLPARVNQHVSILRANKSLIHPKLLHLLLVSPLHKNRLLRVGEGGGTTRQAITKAQLQDYVIRFPKSLDSQLSLIDRIENIKAIVQNTKIAYEQKKDNLKPFQHSILRQAFNGELVKE